MQKNHDLQRRQFSKTMHYENYIETQTDVSAQNRRDMLASRVSQYHGKITPVE
jgi:hypothetical protein